MWLCGSFFFFPPALHTSSLTFSGFSIELTLKCPPGFFGSILPLHHLWIEKKPALCCASLLNSKGFLFTLFWLASALAVTTCSALCAEALPHRTHWGMEQSAFSPESRYTVLQPAPCRQTSSLLPSLCCILKKCVVRSTCTVSFTLRNKHCYHLLHTPPYKIMLIFINFISCNNEVDEVNGLDYI